MIINMLGWVLFATATYALGYAIGLYKGVRQARKPGRHQGEQIYILSKAAEYMEMKHIKRVSAEWLREFERRAYRRPSYRPLANDDGDRKVAGPNDTALDLPPRSHKRRG